MVNDNAGTAEKAKITIVSHRIPTPQKIPDVVRIYPAAGAILRQMQRESGLSATSIVSQIIIQAADMIEFITEE